MLKEDSPWAPPLAALQFLTIIPPIIRRPFTAREMGLSTAYYPLIGALLGLTLWGVDILLAYILPPSVRSACLLSLWIVLSGALHLDGFLDACDGLFGGHTPDSRLEIMRDERIGAFALAGGVLLLLLKFTTLDALPPGWRSSALIMAPAFGRWSMTFALAAFPYARQQGLGRDIKDHTRLPQILLGTTFTLIISWITGGWIGLGIVAVAGLVAWGAARFTLRLIPGLTGDIYGALNELIETAVLLSVLVIAGFIAIPI